jgi:glutathione peroxidase
MTTRQKMLKFFYPLLKRISLWTGKSNRILKSTNMATTSFYDLKTELNNGQELDFNSLRNKKVMLVNTASDCGYTNQYEGLQALHEKYKDKLTIIGFPANDFGEQEKGTDSAIEQFCKVNYGVTFQLAKKSTVVKKEDQNPVYQWLTDENKNGWNYTAPTWNFCKYLVDENGALTHFFEAAIEPMSREVVSALEEQ